uniref:TBC1 domain family member 23 n=1 Tax=Onchocerca volvulus TaxID=6282 RepID=A0A8R1TU05_ONCVO
MSEEEIQTAKSTAAVSDNEYPKILESYRQKWVRNLGIQNKPSVSCQKISCQKNKQIHTSCLKILDRCPSALRNNDLEAMLTMFCEREECDFDESYASILEMLVPLRCTLDELYNIFYAITTKFVPRDISKGAVCYQLMHLIIQYHNPLLSSHLESHKATSFEYGRPFFAALFAPEICKQSLYVIWDKLFERGDPYLLFAMVLVFLINCSDQLMALNSKSELVDTIRFAVKELSINDVDDFLELSVMFLNQTPSSIKQDFQRVLFGSRHTEEIQTDIAKLLALPIDPRDVIRMGLDENLNAAESEPNFFIIDARSHDQYSAGHLDGSYNLDSTLFVEAPLQYKLALSSLDSYRCAFHPDEHILFLGSGCEDDLYLHMVIASFLQQGRKHIALVDGALHKQLAPNFERLDGHYAALCKECNRQLSTEVEKDPQRRSSWKLDVGSILGAVKATAPSIREKVRKLPTIVTLGPNAVEFSHVETSQRHGKRYRNEKSVFTLSDSDSETENIAVTSNPRSSEPKVSVFIFKFAMMIVEMSEPNGSLKCRLKDKLQKLDDILKQSGILEYFEGLEVFTEGASHRTVECYLALTATHILIFHQEEKIKEVVLRARHEYGSVLRVSSKKKIPELLTFKFGYCTDEDDYKAIYIYFIRMDIPSEISIQFKRVTAVHRFIIPRAGDCAKSIKTNIITLRPSILG